MPSHPYHGRISVVVPVKNEQDNVEPLVREISAALSGRAEFEIIYVNDGSTDGTPQVLEQLMTEFPMLRVITHRASCGQSQAVATGVRHARHEWIATLDGDGQNDPADIDRFLHCFAEHETSGPRQLIIGHRRQRHDPGWRQLSSRVANAVRRFLLRDGAADSGCGIKAFSRDFFLELPAFHHMHRFLPALVRQHGGSVFSLTVNHRGRVSGRSHYGTLDRLAAGIVDLLGVAWLGRRAMIAEIEREG